VVASFFCFFAHHQSTTAHMKDIIIPVDFSETSLNAARYAAAMLSGKPDTHVILYNMFTDENESDTAGQYLESLKTEMLQKGVANNIECVKEYGEDLIDCLGRLAYQKNAELIVMGINEKEEWKQLFTRSNTIKMAEQNVCPVMIIPPAARYEGIKNIALTSDFKEVETTVPVLAIKTILEMFNASLHIVNVDNEHYVALTEEYLAERGKMQKLFAEFNPEFYFIGMNDFYEAVEQFSKDRNIDLLIVIPKNHSFVENLFSTSHTKKLAYHSSVPLLAAHE
jgi:nucleotide-binding universal stress UspA family protein